MQKPSQPVFQLPKILRNPKFLDGIMVSPENKPGGFPGPKSAKRKRAKRVSAKKAFFVIEREPFDIDFL